MPTLILVDMSEGMQAPCTPGSGLARLDLVLEGLSTLLDYLATRQRLEFISLVTFARSWEVVVPFTRDIPRIKERLKGLPASSASHRGPSSLECVPECTKEALLSEWDHGTECSIVLVTHESVRVPPSFRLQLPFPADIMVVLIGNGFVPESISSLAKTTSHKLKVYMPEVPLVPRSFHLMFYKMCEEHFSPWIGSLVCGNLTAKIVLSPNPQPYTKLTDFDHVKYTLDQVIEVCGFIEMQHLGSPGAVSRHLVLPYSTSVASLPPPVDSAKAESVRAALFPNIHPAPPHLSPDVKPETDEDASGEGHVPSFCVLLHGALKVEGMAALCYLGKDWYGVLYSWADSKKKSNLVLSLLDPGPEPVPWLGNLNDMVIPMPEEMSICDELPVKPLTRRVFLPNPSSWIRQPGLQADIQKVLRHARKLPDKTQQFFKELNRVRKAALSIGFVQLLEGLAAILERECTMLPGTAHPACALQLSHASSVLKDPSSLDIRVNMMPLKMSF